MARDMEASAQFASNVWLHSFFLAERRVEVLLSAASATAESLDGSRAGVGYPPALLFALGLRRDAFEEQCRACLELGWMGARMAAQQRAAYLHRKTAVVVVNDFELFLHMPRLHPIPCGELFVTKE